MSKMDQAGFFPLNENEKKNCQKERGERGQQIDNA